MGPLCTNERAGLIIRTRELRADALRTQTSTRGGVAGEGGELEKVAPHVVNNKQKYTARKQVQSKGREERGR